MFQIQKSKSELYEELYVLWDKIEDASGSAKLNLEKAALELEARIDDATDRDAAFFACYNVEA